MTERPELLLDELEELEELELEDDELDELDDTAPDELALEELLDELDDEAAPQIDERMDLDRAPLLSSVDVDARGR